ncbi:MAG: FkbM family methyltransferase [Paracoccaceae bacterium]
MDQKNNASESKTPIEVLEAELAKLKRRQERNMRAAHAKGLMQGILSMLKPDDLVLDCGANVGEITDVLAKTGARVHAFEPDPFCFEKLTKRFERAGNVTLHNVAVGTTDGVIQLMRAENFDENPRGASVKSTVISGGRKIDEVDTIEVKLLNLPDFIADKTKEGAEIAFLKMDIEGAELELLEHMRTLGLFEVIRLTVAETHEHKFKELRPRFKKLRADVSAQYPITKVNLDWI